MVHKEYAAPQFRYSNQKKRSSEPGIEFIDGKV